MERAIQLRLAAGQQPTEEMRVLAGLERVKYVLIYPQTHDLVLAGPADDWQIEPEGRLVAKTSGHPVLRLDDLVVILRHMLGSRDARFGCSITPTEAGLAATQEFIAQSNRTPLKPGAERSEAWLKQLRAHLGRQTVTVNGIDPRTHVGRVIVEADYRMKLVGTRLGRWGLGRAQLSEHDRRAEGGRAAAVGRAALVVHAELFRGSIHGRSRRLRNSAGRV